MPLIVAIDGPAGAGKSTVARRAATDLDFTYLDTGAMYRAVAWKAVRAGISPEDEAGLVQAAYAMRLDFGPLSSDGLQSVTLDGEDVTHAIRSPEVSSLTSRISALPGVRRVVVEQQRRIGRDTSQGVVLEGRDIGTVVFPLAEVKIFLTASPEERAHRRLEELKGRGLDVQYETVLAEQQQRDARDSRRTNSPLTPAADAVILNTDSMSIEKVVTHILELVRAAQARREPHLP